MWRENDNCGGPWSQIPYGAYLAFLRYAVTEWLDLYLRRCAADRHPINAAVSPHAADDHPNDKRQNGEHDGEVAILFWGLPQSWWVIIDGFRPDTAEGRQGESKWRRGIVACSGIPGPVSSRS